MTTHTITVDVHDLEPTGPVPAGAELRIWRAQPDVSGPQVVSTRQHTINVGTGVTTFPVTDGVAYGAQFTGVRGYEAAFYFKATADTSIAERILNGQVDPTGFTPLGVFQTIADAIAAIQAQLALETLSLPITAVKTAAYTTVANEIVRLDCSSANVPVQLPTSPPDRTRAIVKRIDNAGTFTATIAAGGTDAFTRVGGGQTHTLTLPLQAVTLQYDAATHVWLILADDFALSQLDLRYVTPAQASATYVPFKAAAKDPDLLIVGGIVRDSQGRVASAAVVWPDGTAGSYTALAFDPTGATNSYSITYGSPVTKTYTQPTITRDSTGAAITVPQITVA